MGCFTVPAVFFRHCSFWLLVIPKDAASHRFTSFAEIENWLQNRLQRRVIFSRIAWNSKIVWKMGKSSRQRQYFNWSVHSFCFEINAQKKQTELICTPNILTYNNFYDFKISQHTNLLVINILFYNTRKGKDYYLYIK